MHLAKTVDVLCALKYRQQQVFTAGSAYLPPPAMAVPGRMAEFAEGLARTDDAIRQNMPDALHPVERAAHAHLWLVDIHPFVDGNGRTARLLINLLLLQAGYPIAILRNEDRAIYYTALEEAHEGRLESFLHFVAEAVDRTMDLFLSASAE